MPFQEGHKDFRTKEGLKRMGKKISKIRKGIKLSNVTKEKIRKANLGKKLTEQHKIKIGEANKGRIVPKEQIERIRKLNLGKHLSDKTRKKLSIAHKGKRIRNKNPMWKGGKTIWGNYIYIRNSNYGYIAEHRLVIEKYLKRRLTKKEVIHHINGDTKDNRIENLKLYKNSGTHVWSEHLKK